MNILHLSKFDWPTQPLYSCNPWIGCYFNCSYCWSHRLAKRWNPKINWTEPRINPLIDIKTSNLSWNDITGEFSKIGDSYVLLSATTDPYQPLEAEALATHGLLRFALKSKCRVLILTKSPLVLSDLDLLKQFGDRVEVGFTITGFENRPTLEEPEAPPNSERARAVMKIKKAGLKTYVSLEPWLPSLYIILRIETLKSYVDRWIIGPLDHARSRKLKYYYAKRLTPLIDYAHREGLDVWLKGDLVKCLWPEWGDGGITVSDLVLKKGILAQPKECLEK